MSTMALDRSLFTVSIPSVETKKFKQFIKLMGWTATAAPAPARARLYDPETKEYLNDETMQVIKMLVTVKVLHSKAQWMNLKHGQTLFKLWLNTLLRLQANSRKILNWQRREGYC